MKLKKVEEIKSEKLSAVISEGKDYRKGTNGISKKSVTYHKGGADAAGQYATPDDQSSLFNTSVAPPTEEQLSRINKYTRSPKTADELVAFTTLSANTLPDRDDDYFDKETIQGFAELPEPYGPTGKSYMVGHDYTKLPQGRIFGTDTKDAVGTHFLTNEVYVPNTQKNQGFIEDLDFGVNWAVSVGVMLDAQLCSICQAPQYGGWFFGGVCDNGHFKSEYYDPAEDRTDDYGYIIPAREGDPKAVKCYGVMHGAQDFYELSQVFLGAQFHAALESPEGKGAAGLKRAKTAFTKGVFLSPGIPILGLSANEAEALPLQHTDPKVAEALEKFAVEREKDGSLKWADGEGLIWSYTPGDSITCLGKSSQDDETEEDEDGEGSASVDGSEAVGEAGSSGEDGDGSGEQGSEHDRSGDSAGGSDDPGVGDADGSAVGSDGDLTDDEDDDDTEKGVNSAMSKAAVLAAAKRAKCPEKLLTAINAAEGDGLEAVLRAASSSITELSAQVGDLTPKAALGEKFLKDKRATAIDAYVKSFAGQQGGVDTTKFEKMLDRFGDDVELIEDITEQYRNALKSKLPAAVRRSSEPVDPNERQEPQHGEPGDKSLSPRANRTVSRIHG